MSNAVDKKELSRVIKKIMEHLAYDSYFDDDDWIGIEQIVALIGASKEVTEEWIEKWEKKFPACVRADIIWNKRYIKQMLKEAGVEVVGK